MSHFSRALLTLLGTLLLCLLWTAGAFTSGTILPTSDVNSLFFSADLALTVLTFTLLWLCCFAPIRRPIAVLLVTGSGLLFLTVWHRLLSNLITDLPLSMITTWRWLPVAAVGLITLGFVRLIKAYRLSRLLLGSYRQVEHSLSTRDQLTQLFNRRYFYSQGTELLNSHQANQQCSTLIMLVLHNLADINREHGLQAGDAVLSELGRVLLKNTRRNDIAARVSGRKLAVFLPHTDAQQASPLAERIVAMLKKVEITIDTGERELISLSVGLEMQQSQPGDSLETLEDRNRAALNRAA